MDIRPGLRADLRHTVTPEDTAVALGSGDVPVLGTPWVLALAERATVLALEGALEQGVTSVGVRVELEHLAASPVGASMEVEAVLDRVEGRRLEFAVEIRDGGRAAARARITRVLVDRAPFLDRSQREASR